MIVTIGCNKSSYVWVKASVLKYKAYVEVNKNCSSLSIHLILAAKAPETTYIPKELIFTAETNRLKLGS